jgi:endonuclease/exonuclease/phosphatase family metal-dependent hydrolase
MKLITWNIQWGLGMDGRVDLARIVAEARRIADFDVLCLQEVADGFSDLEGHDGGNQFDALAALLPGYPAIEGIAVDLPGEAGRRRRFGSMILSRLQIGRIMRHALPWDADDATRNVPRILLDIEVSAEFGPVRVMTTHLEYFSASLRARQVAAIRDIYRLSVLRARHPPQRGTGPYALGEMPAATILTGDFNMPPDDPVKRSLSEPMGDVQGLIDVWENLHPGVPHPPSFCIADQKYGPPHCCDFVLVSPDLAPGVRRIAYETETRASDHQPVLLDLSGAHQAMSL